MTRIHPEDVQSFCTRYVFVFPSQYVTMIDSESPEYTAHQEVCQRDVLFLGARSGFHWKKR